MIRLESITISGTRIDFDPPIFVHESEGILIKHDGSIVWSQTHKKLVSVVDAEEDGR